VYARRQWGAGVEPGMATRVATVGGRSNRSVVWAEDFLYAGTSALLLLIAGRWPVFQLLGCVALTPLFLRVWRIGARHAFRVGLLFGLAYFTVLAPDPHHEGLVIVGLRAAGGMAALGAFGWLFSASRRLVGGTPVLGLVWWAAADYVVALLGMRGGMLGALTLNGHLSGVAVVFGFLCVSLFLVLINIVVLLAVHEATRPARARECVLSPGRNWWPATVNDRLVPQVGCSLVAVRGPPL